MKILLDENVPVQATAVLECTLRGHSIAHVDTFQRRGTRWKGKKDKHLLPDLKAAGFQVFVTKDRSQLSDPEETRLIRQSKVHHVRFTQAAGMAGFARAVGALIAAMPGVVQELESVAGQRLVRIQALDPKVRRFEIVDPATDPPAYWKATGRRVR